MSLANIGKFKLSLKALILSVFTFICFLVFSNVFCRTKIFFVMNLSVVPNKSFLAQAKEIRCSWADVRWVLSVGRESIAS